MSILIKGMEMPADGNETIIRIQPDGTVLDQYGHHLAITSVSIPEHGRLIDADAAVANRYAEMNWAYDLSDLPDYLADCPTIIPAEENHDA